MTGPWWLMALAGVGVLALGTAVITLFFKLGRRPSRVWSVEAPPPESDEFLRGIAGIVNAPLQEGGTAELLNNGDAFFQRIFEDVEHARSTINFGVYIWEPGDVSDRMLALLARKAEEGIQVRLLLDAVGGLRIPDDGVERLKAAGGQVSRFRPPVLGKLTRVHKRNHRRAIVIDGVIGYTGGAAMGDKWQGDARTENEWRDAMVRLTGCAAGTLQAAFAEIWAYTSGEILSGDDFYPKHDDGARADLPPAARPLRYHAGVVSSPSDDEYPLRLFFILTFLAARKRLYIATPYFVPDSNTREIVARRAREGVDVRILVPGAHTDAPPIRRTGQHYYAELLAGGVRIYEYQPTMMHAKLCTADGVWSIIGSANMDIRSKELNNENVIGIQDAALAADIERTFLADLERAREIKPDEWRKRPLGARVLERLFAVFAEQY